MVGVGVLDGIEITVGVMVVVGIEITVVVVDRRFG